ncbi:hypothetical protein V5799_017963, partial [Amblyomma americanum]
GQHCAADVTFEKSSAHKTKQCGAIHSLWHLPVTNLCNPELSQMIAFFIRM